MVTNVANNGLANSSVSIDARCRAFDIREYDLDKPGVKGSLREHLLAGRFCTKNIALASFLITQGRDPADVVPIHKKISFYVFENGDESCEQWEHDFKMKQTKVFPQVYAEAQRQLKTQVDYALKVLDGRGLLFWRTHEEEA